MCFSFLWNNNKIANNKHFIFKNVQFLSSFKVMGVRNHTDDSYLLSIFPLSMRWFFNSYSFHFIACGVFPKGSWKWANSILIYESQQVLLGMDAFIHKSTAVLRAEVNESFTVALPAYQNYFASYFLYTQSNLWPKNMIKHEDYS